LGCRNNGQEFPTAGCCEAGGAPVAELPCVEGGAPALPALPPGYIVPPGTPPATNGMPRLAPVPQGPIPAPVYPSPQSRLKDSRPGELELVH